MCDWGTTVPVDAGRTVDVDACLAPMVAALNDAGLRTVASCCGHGHRPGSVALADGRELLVMADYRSARALDRLWPDIHGDWPER